MPIVPHTSIVYSLPPDDVDKYLRSRGWWNNGNNLWQKYDSVKLGNEEFQWPEALAYEIFQNFVMLKTPGE